LQVRLIGYCVEGSLFLVYEYVENGNLGQHLHGSGTQYKDLQKWIIFRESCKLKEFMWN